MPDIVEANGETAAASEVVVVLVADSQPMEAAAASVVEAVPVAEADGEAAPAEPVLAGVVAAADGGPAAAVVATGPGVRLGAALLSDEVGPAINYERAMRLTPRKDLLKLFVTDDHLLTLWTEIGRLEIAVAELRQGSPKAVAELIDRLSAARNMLLHSRDQYDNALRELLIVRQRLTRIQHSMLFQQPWVVQGYLTLFLVALAVGFMQAARITAVLGNPGELVGIDPRTLWNTIVWGGIGGLSAALYSLKRHVEDYDFQHARWYYLSPFIGLFFGPLAALLANVGLPALFQLTAETTGATDVRPAVLYLLAWTVGFKQNLLFAWINAVLKRFVPEADDDGQAPEASRPVGRPPTTNPPPSPGAGDPVVVP